MTDQLESQVEDLPITPVEEEVQEPKDESSPEDIARAQRMGWTDKDQFKGDPAKWRTAKEYVERAETELPIARERNKKLDENLQRTQSELAEIKRDMKDFVKFTRDAARREALAEIENLKAKQDEAFDAGDKEAFQEAGKQIAELEKKVPSEVAPVEHVKAEPPKEISDWFTANPWYAKDPQLQRYADKMGEFIKDDEGLIGTKLLDRVREEVEKRFPEKFSNPNRSKAAVVGAAGGNNIGSPGGGKKGRSFADLPREAQITCNNWVAKGIGTREEFLKGFQWD